MRLLDRRAAGGWQRTSTIVLKNGVLLKGVRERAYEYIIGGEAGVIDWSVVFSSQGRILQREGTSTYYGSLSGRTVFAPTLIPCFEVLLRLVFTRL